jgi:arginase
MDTRIILVPYDSGHYQRRMGCGPDRIFEQLKPLLKKLGIEFEAEEIQLENLHPAEISAAFELGRKVAQRLRACRTQGEFAIVLSGNCNVAVGTVSGCGAQHTGIVWFDAHGEANTPETTPSGFLDGMPIATLLGRTWQTLAKSVPGFTPLRGESILLFGARQFDSAEPILLDKAGVRRVDTLKELTRELLVLRRQVSQLYVHVDLDVLDPTEATANQWTPPNGITVRTLLDAIAEARRHMDVVALGIASYEPAIDQNGRALSAAVEVIKAVLPAS